MGTLRFDEWEPAERAWDEIGRSGHQAAIFDDIPTDAITGTLVVAWGDDLAAWARRARESGSVVQWQAPR